MPDKLHELMQQLPNKLLEEGSTGRDLIENIIHETQKQEKVRIITLMQHRLKEHSDKLSVRAIINELDRSLEDII